MPKPPTERQLAVLRFIGKSVEERGFPPTIKEIGAALGIASNTAVTDHLGALERKGLIRRAEVSARGISLTHEAMAHLPGVKVQPTLGTSRYVSVVLGSRCSVCLAVTFAPERPCFNCSSLMRRPAEARAYFCGACGKRGHNTRTCPEQLAEAVSSG